MSINLKFSEKYDKAHAQRYLQKHQDGVFRRLSHWRDEQIARQALEIAGDPGLVLDLPSGAGRFWPLLAENPRRVLMAADNSRDMLDTACRAQPREVVERVRTVQTSAFEIELPTHSLWVDGNYKAWRRKRLESKRTDAERLPAEQNRFVIPRAVIEAEFAQAGFVIEEHIDFLPMYAMWRVYVLRAV